MANRLPGSAVSAERSVRSNNSLRLTGHPPQVLVVVVLQRLPDRLIQFFKAGEGAISLRDIDPLE